MKEEVSFSCGCTLAVELPADKKAREAVRRRMQTHGCRDCDYQEKIRRAKQRAEQRGLVALSGTPRQVDYALILRDQQVTWFLEQLDRAERADPEDPRIEQLRGHLVGRANTKSDASWWIEHQELKHLRSLLKEEKR